MSKGLPYMLERAGLDVQQGKNYAPKTFLHAVIDSQP